jgi:UDP-3-O-[3-hydroxymyristoyl] glucosamine N-acyltransferase
MLTLAQLAREVDGEVVGDGSVAIAGIAPADSAKAGDLTFAEKPSYLAAAEQSQASAIVVPPDFVSATKVLLRVKNPRAAIARLLPLLYPPAAYPPGIHPSAAIDPTAQVDPSAHVGPLCAIGAGARVGRRAALLGGNHLGPDCAIGEDTVLHPQVVIYRGCRIGQRVAIHAGTVIGADGYGYVFDQGRHRKVPQVGNVVIEDDVEIGANTAIDCGALASTVIGEGTKIDNLVHIAHNVVVGRHCLIMGQCGFAGSTRLGDYVVVASQSGVAGHLKLGDRSVVGAKSGVMRDIPDGTTVLGYPAAPDQQAKRQWVGMAMLPDLIRRVRDLERQAKAADGK